MGYKVVKGDRSYNYFLCGMQITVSGIALRQEGILMPRGLVSYTLLNSIVVPMFLGEQNPKGICFLSTYKRKKRSCN